MVHVAGVDGYAGGWVAVVTVDGAVSEVQTFPTVADLLATTPRPAVYGIDIPIGLPTDGVRAADAAARAFVGARRSSVFNTAPRAVIEAPTYEAARQIAAERFDRGVSAQSYRLRDKVLEVDAVAGPDLPLYEVHPEVSFRAMKGAPLGHPKRTWNGQMERRSLLLRGGIELPDHLEDAGDVPVDDVLDAAAVAWSAGRIARGDAVSLPHPPERDARGRPMAIWY